MLAVVFAVSMFLSSVLLFLVEPMIAKMLLPRLGGTPAVWNTCLVFYQAALLAGYLYAHASVKWLGRRWQIAIHLALVILPLAIVGLLPLHIPAGAEPPSQSSPVLWVLAILSTCVGLPFFILSSTAPLLQRWFARTGHSQAEDPYFLYAASNAGSLMGLLAYPLVFEPLLRLNEQSRLWTYGYALYVAAALACAALVWRSRKVPSAEASGREDAPDERTWRQRLRWVLLAFVPSSLMLGVTTALTTDVPSIPLLWVLSLSIYLVSFILVFARRPPISHQWIVAREPFLILAGLMPIISKTKYSFPLMLALELLVLFGVAMVCHGELAKSRPSVNRLTEFYLLISAGGVLGGIFNSLVAPVIFRSVLELPLVLILAALLRPVSNPAAKNPRAAVWAKRNDWLLPIALCAVMLIVILGVEHVGIRPGRSLNIIIFGYSLVWCLSFAKRRLRFVLGLIAVMTASSFYTGPFGRVLHTERSFFGVSRVTEDPNGKFRSLFHGGTAHGIQSLDPARSREPLSYYTRGGPAGQIMRAAQTKMPQGDWAIVGLGAGAMACYLQPGQTLTYYEIDPVVTRIAEDPRYFTFLSQCAPQGRVVLGDARLKLRDAPDGQYGLIVLDAFSGDSIPIHLVTREALALYARKLAPHGMIAFHISNLYMDLSQTLAALAGDAHLVCLMNDDTAISQAQIDAGTLPSRWIVMARSADDLTLLRAETGVRGRWTPVAVRAGRRVWTDDYSNLLSAIKWGL